MSVPVGQRNVPETVANVYLETGVKARNLALHTIKICCNKNVFLPEYQSSLTDDLIKTSKDIFTKICEANSIRVQKKSDWEKRREMQNEALRLCGSMICMISLAKALFHLRSKKVKHWVDLVSATKAMVRKWHEKDQERYKDVS